MRDEIERLRRMIDDTGLFKVMSMNMKASHPEYIHGGTTLTLEIHVDERELSDDEDKELRRMIMSEFVDAPKGVKIKKEPKQPSFTELLRGI